MASETVENYIKAIYVLCRESPSGEAGVVRLAQEVGVTKGTATSMIKRLAKSKLVKAPRYSGVTLTAMGKKIALDVLRRHRIIETFLVSTLNLDWADVHEEAERLEHALSPRTLDRLDEFLGRPSTDPHGDPIPSASGKVLELRGKALSAFARGAKVEIVQIMDQDRAFLKFVAQSGLKPRVRALVQDVSAQGDSITLRVTRGKSVTLSRSAASKILARLQ
ncbi:MAG: metal-dependent transcriptional regulator [Planctomycetota bacterium]|nr:metal-dependent transcriptional regulator [Planctomycetota bacterium]MDA1261773.1 metal-dependent transcriptional regulator [Planctomycetota bacterium]